MKKIFGRKILSGLLAVMMMCSLFPVSVMADETDAYTEGDTAVTADEANDTAAEASSNMYLLTDEGYTDDNESRVSAVDPVEYAGKLTVILKVEGDDVESDRIFPIQVTLSDTSVNGEYYDMTFVNGVATLQASLNGKSEFLTSGINRGVRYEVSVPDDLSADGYTVSYPYGNSGYFIDGAGTYIYVKYTRTREGNLTVTNELSGFGAEPNKDFSYTITANTKDGSPVNGTFGAVTFENGSASFTLKHDQTINIKGLKNGTQYTITQEDYSADDYVTDPADYKISGTITTNTTNDETFYNTKKLTGTLEVKNQVYGSAADTDKAFNYTITLGDTDVEGKFGEMEFTDGIANIALKSGESVKAEGLPYCSYEVVQDDYTEDGYTTTSTGESGTITYDETAVASFENNRNSYSNLTVSCDVISAADDPNQVFNYTITLRNQTISAKYGDMTFVDGQCTFSLKNGEKITGTDFPNDIYYIITQESVDGYVTSSTNSEGFFTGIDKTAAFKNTSENTGSLMITNKLSGNDYDNDKDFDFTIKLGNETINETFSDVAFTNGTAKITLKDGESKTIEGLPENISYTVTEADYSSDGYKTTYTGESGTIKKDTEASAAFANERNTYGNIKVSMNIAGNAPRAEDEFMVLIELSDTTVTGTYGDIRFYQGKGSTYIKGGESVTASGFANGTTYTVSTGDYTSLGYVSTYSDNKEGTVTGDETQEVTITQTRDVNSTLTVKCVLEGNDTDPSKEFLYTVDLHDEGLYVTYSGIKFYEGIGKITLKGGESFTFDGIPNGTSYTVKQFSKDGQAVTDYKVTKTGYEGKIDETNPAVAVFTNTRNNEGYLTVTNSVIGNEGDKNEEFEFKVTLSDTTVNGTIGDMEFTNGVAVLKLKDGGSASTTIATDTTYTVTETDTKGYVVSKSGDTGTITRDNTSTASFKNTKDYTAAIKLSLKLEGNDTDPDKAFEYTITLAGENVDGTYSGIEFTDGKATIKLRDGESFTISSLPIGISASVTQKSYADNGYKANTLNVSGTLEDGKTLNADFVNTRNTIGTLKVTNVITGSSSEKDKRFSYTITLSDTSITSEDAEDYGDVQFKNGVGELTMIGSQTAEITDLPNGITYTVVQKDVTSEGYVTTEVATSGTIKGNDTITAVFVNSRDGYGNLTVTNSTVGGNPDFAFDFTITLADTGISGTFGDVTFSKGVGTVSLVNGKSAKITGLPAGVAYEVTEPDYYTEQNYRTTSTGEKGSIKTNETLMAAFVNTYDYERDDGGKGDDGEDADTDDTASGGSASGGNSASGGSASGGNSTSGGNAVSRGNTAASGTTLPETADHSGMSMYLMLLLSAAMCAAGCIAIKKKKEEA